MRRLSSLMMMNGQTNASQVSRQVKMARVNTAGQMSGTTIRKYVPSSPAPSIRAASTSESGSPSMNWRIKKTPKASATAGMTSPW